MNFINRPMTRITLKWKPVKPPPEDGLVMGYGGAVYDAVSQSAVYCNAAPGLCDKQWGDLIATSHPETRFCEHCHHEVHLVKTYKQLVALRHSGLCVAYAGKRPLAGKVVP